MSHDRGERPKIAPTFGAAAAYNKFILRGCQQSAVGSQTSKAGVCSGGCLGSCAPVYPTYQATEVWQ